MLIGCCYSPVSIVYRQKCIEYTRHEHRQTPTIFNLKLWTFALLFFSLDMELLGLLVCLWTFKWVGGPLVGDFGCAVFMLKRQTLRTWIEI